MAAAAWGASVRAEPVDPSQAADQLRAKYAADLEKIAKSCEANGLPAEARKTRRVLSPTDPYKLYIPALPDQVGPPKLPDDAPAKVVDWNTKLWKLRTEHALACYEMARRAVRSGRAGLAFVLVLDAIQANPDFEPARRLLGYQKYQGQWHTLYDVRKLRSGFVWNEKFGWLPKAQRAPLRKRENASATAAGSRPTTTQNATKTSARAGGSRPSTT